MLGSISFPVEPFPCLPCWVPLSGSRQHERLDGRPPWLASDATDSASSLRPESQRPRD